MMSNLFPQRIASRSRHMRDGGVSGSRPGDRPGRRELGATELKPLDSSELIEQVAGWLSQKENHQWLDFADGAKVLTPTWLKIMARNDRHLLRVFTADGGEPIGIVALDSLDRERGTATLWGALGEKRYARRGYTTRAMSEIVRSGFQELGLHVINTWVVEHNPSVKIILRLNFRLVGRQRQCHWIDGRAYDRLLFDLLASEYSGLEPMHE